MPTGVRPHRSAVPWLLASLWLQASGALAQERPALEPRMEGGRVRYENAGLAAVKELVQADDISAAVGRATKRNLERWKADWLASLEASR